MRMKGQEWVTGVIGGIIGIVIAAVVVFSQIGSVHSVIGNASNASLATAGQALTTSEASLANLIPFVLIAGFVLLVVALFLRYK